MVKVVRSVELSRNLYNAVFQKRDSESRRPVSYYSFFQESR